MDWLTWNWDAALAQYVTLLHEDVDTILIGRKMVGGFLDAWNGLLNDPTQGPFAHKMVDTPKVVFSKTVTKSEWVNTTVANGDIADGVNKLKKQEGKDMIVYGGAGLVSSLIKERLIDDYYFFVNPAIIGEGLPIFKEVGDRLQLKLVKATGYDCGITVLHYQNA